MPNLVKNPWRGQGIDLDVDFPSDDPSAVSALLSKCPMHAPTPLVDSPELAQKTGVAQVLIKDERARMDMGSFKALGAAYAIAREAAATGNGPMTSALKGRSYVTASAGNHGLSVAMGAQVFGAQAIIFLAETVPSAFAGRLESLGATVVVEGADYEASMIAAQTAADANDWTLLSDSTWAGYTALPYFVMEGYLQLAAEAADQMAEPPTHILLQAGVGGLACAIAAYARKVWGDAPQIIVVEPMAAPALQASVEAGAVVDTEGPVSSMGRLDCKTPSLMALKGLSRDADVFATICEKSAAEALPVLAGLGLDSTESGAAGLAALLAGLPIGPEARVWAILSEGPEDGGSDG